LSERPRIAIPVPHSGDPEYAERALPQYVRAVEMAGGEPVRIPLEQSSEMKRLIQSCDGVLLPGSRADVDPAKYQAQRHPQTAASDEKRDDVDELLLRDADSLRKPVLGICYGLQSLNVHRRGSLLQHIETPVNHAIGRKADITHKVNVEPGSMLAGIVGANGPLPVNSSHHQSAEKPGADLRVVAHSAEDGIVEAIEGTSPDHFVLAVQWHPERSVDLDEPSRAIFRALVKAARQWHEKRTDQF
jgi:putative glutamine amidotransferase